ncbi:antA/AntB antirepressor family protein [Mesobacillus foraminis]|uniref:antA/AntB antirepressor family protein n=1 Tax=Mesobacillus foraminis TaxID=279826 RepID=UPI001BE59622|nr:antA/AntB antirepressor family protein [Mesobacillus foraminis]MBT2755893.1 antA/AntB antirepressor family protein [Mesobacillus foraminis]
MKFEILTVELLVIYQNQAGAIFVNARDLHKTLMIKQKFPRWIKRKIETSGFSKGKDFLTQPSKINGRSSTEYLLTIHAAKSTAKASFESKETSIDMREYLSGVGKRFGLQKSPSSSAELLLVFAKQLVDQEQSLNKANQEIRELQQQRYIWDNLDINGDQQQQLVQKVHRYAALRGIAFPKGWNEFKRAFNIAFKTNLKLRVKNYELKHGLNELTTPQYLSLVNQIADGLRVADAMLKKVS